MPIMKNKEDVEAFEKLQLQVYAARREMAELSRKKPNDALNKFKLRLINQILSKANIILAQKPTLDGFELFDEDQLPTNSDVVFVLAQYSDALQTFRIQNSKTNGGANYYWITDEDVKIAAPDPRLKKYLE